MIIINNVGAMAITLLAFLLAYFGQIGDATYLISLTRTCNISLLLNY